MDILEQNSWVIVAIVGVLAVDFLATKLIPQESNLLEKASTYFSIYLTTVMRIGVVSLSYYMATNL